MDTWNIYKVSGDNLPNLIVMAGTLEEALNIAKIENQSYNAGQLANCFDSQEAGYENMGNKR